MAFFITLRFYESTWMFSRASHWRQDIIFLSLKFLKSNQISVWPRKLFFSMIFVWKMKLRRHAFGPKKHEHFRRGENSSRIFNFPLLLFFYCQNMKRKFGFSSNSFYTFFPSVFYTFFCVYKGFGYWAIITGYWQPNVEKTIGRAHKKTRTLYDTSIFHTYCNVGPENKVRPSNYKI